MKTLTDFLDWIKNKKPSIVVNLIVPKDFPYNDHRFHKVSVTMDDIQCSFEKGRTTFFTGELKLDLEGGKY